MLGTPLFLPLLRYWKLDPNVLDLAEPFMFALRWSTLPLLLYASVRRYLQSMSLVRPVMFALISANVVNFIGNWIFIYGNLGAPAFGVEGSAWSTAFARVYMFGILAAYVLYRERRLHTGLFTRRAMAFDWGRIRQLLRLGGPAASQILLEIGVFGAATVLAGKLSPVALAAHQIALNSASLTYMVPLGIASAAAISVGQAIGRQDPMAARRSGWIALALGAGFMFFAGICFYLFPYQILGVYTSDRATLDLGAAILLIAAVFQLFDGVQTVAIGALRGAGNTRTPMIVNLVGYWGVGLPAGYLLCFNEHLGIVGLWVGLSAGLIIVAIVLLISWSQAIRSSP
jgi:MATE family multidrug resistance protein